MRLKCVYGIGLLVTLLSIPGCQSGTRAENVLFGAAVDGDIRAVKQSLAEGASVNARDDAGETALDCAVRQNHADLARYLLQQGAVPNLHDAAGLGDEPLVESLIRGGADVNAPDVYGTPPLHWAARNGRLGTIRVLLSKGAAVNGKEPAGDNMAAIHYAAMNGHNDAVELLLQKGADVDARDKTGTTALDYAAANSAFTTVQVLVRHHASVDLRDSTGMTALATAAYRGRQDMAELLLRAGANPNAKVAGEYGPLHWAVRGGHYDLAKQLISRGGKVNIFVAAGLGDKATVGKLVGNGHAVNAKDIYGFTALHWAAEGGRNAVAAYLLHNGWDVNAVSTSKATPLHAAIYGPGSLQMRSPLSGQMCNSQREANKMVAVFLVNSGADADAKDGSGRTPAQLAKVCRYSQVLKAIEAAGRR